MNDGRRRQGGYRGKDGSEEDPLHIWMSFQDPMMRWGDVPGSALLAEQRMLHPDDPYLRDLHHHLQQDQLRRAMMSGDPFHGNPPPAGTLPTLEPGRIPIATLLTGDVLSLAVRDVMKNVCVVGPTGGGKTNWLRILIAAVLEGQP